LSVKFARDPKPGISSLTTLLLFIRSALSGLRQTPFVHGVAVLTLGIALFAGAVARAGQQAVQHLLLRLGGETEMTLYLAETASPAQVADLQRQVQGEAGTAVRLVSAEEALGRLRGELGASGTVLDGLPENPLPRSLEVRPPPGPPDAARLRKLADRWAQLPGVTGVDYGREWIDRLAALDRALTQGAGAVLSLVLLAAVIVVAATLQLAAYARRDEIEIQKLVGATDLFVRVPFVIEGAFQGLMSAALAVGGLLLGQHILGPLLRESLTFLANDPSLPALVDPRRVVEVLGAGLGLGILGSSIAVGRFLRV
jgi:cell division transport system permease protein